MSTTTISSFRTFRLFCLAVAGLLFVQAGTGKAAIFLMVNGMHTGETVFVETGQPCIIEIVSNDNSEYDALVGFESDPLGQFDHIETKPQAGTEAGVIAWNEPWPFDQFYGYGVWAFGGPSQGVHFVFQCTASRVDQPTTLGLWLWDSIYENVYQVDAVEIIALPPEGACCDQVTGNCYSTCYSWDCWYTWLGAGTDCSMCGALPLTVTSPNGGECLLGNASYMVTWSGGGSISNVLIEYSSDNDQNWTAIIATPNSGSYSWPVPAVDSNQCLVRISDVLNPSVSDTSDSVFTIESTRYSGGIGEPNNPYRIATPEDLNDIGNHEDDWGKHFILVNDVNLAEYTGTQFKIIGDGSNPFIGVFDGNEHVILNADINMPASDCVALFGCLGTGGQIRNLGVEDASIFGRYCVGGLVGYNDHGAINNCHSTGSVTGFWDVGGLVGENYRGTASNCYSTGSVVGDGYLGGLVGHNEYGAISDCYSTGSVNGTGDSIGGLVGRNEGHIANCYSTGSVCGTTGVGGLVGVHESGEVGDSFWDVEASEQSSSAGGTPKTTVEMKTQSTFTSAGWDFIDVWDIGENQTYPFLRTYLAGDINHDGVIDFRDIAYLAESWLSGL